MKIPLRATRVAYKALRQCATSFRVGNSRGIDWERLAREFNRRQKVAGTALIVLNLAGPRFMALRDALRAADRLAKVFVTSSWSNGKKHVVHECAVCGETARKAEDILHKNRCVLAAYTNARKGVG